MYGVYGQASVVFEQRHQKDSLAAQGEEDFQNI